MRGRWRSQLRQHPRQWADDAVASNLLLAVAFLATAGCHTSQKQNLSTSVGPEVLYQRARGEFIGGDLLVAEQTDEQAVASYTPANPLWVGRFNVELARVYLYQGRTVEAARLLQLPLPSEAEQELLIRRDLLLAISQNRLKHLELADEALKQAEAMHPAGVLHAELLLAHGSVALERGQIDASQEFLEAVLKTAQKDREKFIETQAEMNLGVIALQLEHYEDALDHFHGASAAAQSIGARLAQEMALGNLGWTYYETGDFARSLQSTTAAESEAAAIGATLDQVQWLKNSGMSQFQLGNISAARSSYEQSLALAESIHSDDEILGAHVALGYLLVHLQPYTAEVHIKEASRIARLSHLSDDELEPSLLEAMLLIEQGQAQQAETALRLLEIKAAKAPSIQWAAENTLASLYAKANRNADADHWFERAISTFHRQRLSLRSVELQLPFLENGSNLYLGYMEHLIHTGRSDEALKILDDSRAETLAEGLRASGKQSSASRISPQTLAARLHATILIYCLRPNASYLWASDGSRQKFYTLPGSTTLLPLVAQHTQAILASKDLLLQSDAPGRMLYDALVKPAAEFVPPGGRVFIIGDKELSGLNFETLIASSNKPHDGIGKPHYWIEDATVINARSLRLLASSQARSVAASGKTMLLIGDPIYRSAEYSALPNAAVEMDHVSSHFAANHRSLLAGVQASPAVYPAASPARFSYIHFVAHATANELNPLDSAIILSGEPGSTRLYARDILKQPITADLVTLSSCYGSGIRNYSGEGVVGLAWAFLRAGAHSVIGAMWEVSDVSTPKLMDAMYTDLLAGKRPEAALRAAKLSLLHSDGVFRKPLYWASFQLYSGR